MQYKNSRTKNYLLITASSGIYRILYLVLNFITRTVFIYTLGAEYLGLNSLFINILNILSLTELGVGSAITFHLYKPIAENDETKINLLVHFFKKAYIVIGIVIAVLGIALIPTLDLLVNFDNNLDVNLYAVYLLWLMNTVISYLFFSYTQVILLAMQKSYLINSINTIFLIVSTVMTCCVLLITHNYLMFLSMRIAVAFINNWIIKRTTYRICPYLNEKNVKALRKNEFWNICKDVYSIFVVKASSAISASLDSIVISIFFGTVIVGYNGNYDMLIHGIKSIIYLIIYSFQAGIGDLNVTTDMERKIRTFREIDFINFVIVIVAFSGVWNLGNIFIRIWLHNENFVFSNGIVFMKAIIMLYEALLYTCYVFRESMGLFAYAKYNHLFAGIFNWILTVTLAKFIGLPGVFLATIISSLSIAAFAFPKVVFKYGFHADYKIEQFRYLYKILFAILVAGISKIACLPFKDINTLGSFIIQILINIFVCVILIFIFFHRTAEYKGLILRIRKVMKRSDYGNN